MTSVIACSSIVNSRILLKIGPLPPQIMLLLLIDESVTTHDTKSMWEMNSLNMHKTQCTSCTSHESKRGEAWRCTFNLL